MFLSFELINYKITYLVNKYALGSAKKSWHWLYHLAVGLSLGSCPQRVYGEAKEQEGHSSKGS